MTEKEQFIGVWEREYPTTVKVLKAYPAAKSELKPHERSKTAKELAWNFVVEENVMDQCLNGGIDFQKIPAPPATMAEVIAAYEKSHKEMVARVGNTSEGDLNKTVKFFVAPKQMGVVRIMDILWLMLMDSVHHRGQFSVYLRMSGAKVPSIYGPTADEPWM